jgi:hypothetical protein
MKAGRVHFFCPLCHYHQSTNTIRRVSWKHCMQVSLLTCTSVYLAWPVFGYKGVFLLFPYLAVFEFIYRLRKRQALVCQSCGFDPFLYKQDIGKARAALRQHWEKRIENENLFVGKKLKNYRTKPINQPTQGATSEGTPLDEKSEEASASTTTAPSP